MEELSVKSIVFVNFPFSDLQHSKLRPAVIVAYAQHKDWVLCQITSKAYADTQGIKISDNDFESGSLKIDSYIRPSKIFTAHESIINKKIGILKPEKHSDLVKAIVELVSWQDQNR